MTEIREIFETVRTYCGMMFGDEKAARQLGSEAAKRNLDAKMPRCLEASVTKEDTKLLRHYGTKVVSDNNSLETVFSRFTSHFSLPKAAFTLAEVLITLGIIGVVAALTLPTLIQNHQKQVYVTQLKKAYSTLGNAFNKMAVDEGVVDWKQTYCANLSMDSSNSEIQSCLNNFAKTVKVIKTTKLGFGKYSDNFVMNDNIDTALVLEDGTTYNFLVYGCGFYGDIIVDVNGLEKGSNQYGRDIFQFNIDYDNNKVVPTGTASWNPDVWKSCSATNLSTLCTVKVLIEGKMNY